MVTLIALPSVAVVSLHARLVVGLPAGAWVDRVRRRPLIWADIWRAVAPATVPAAAAVSVLTVAHLVAVATVAGLLTVLFDVAYPVYLPSVVGRGRPVDANGKLQASASVATIGGAIANFALAGTTHPQKVEESHICSRNCRTRSIA
jgi:MFS family permease